MFTFYTHYFWKQKFTRFRHNVNLPKQLLTEFVVLPSHPLNLGSLVVCLVNWQHLVSSEEVRTYKTPTYIDKFMHYKLSVATALWYHSARNAAGLTNGAL